MILIATGQPTAKADEAREPITLRIPSGDRECVKVDLTLNQCFMLEQRLRRAAIKMLEASREATEWRANNVLAFPFDRARRAEA